MDEGDPNDEKLVTAAARFLAEAQSILFVTGAGISADSGVPTYRGVGGLYDSQDTEDGLSIEDCLSGQMFRRDPAKTWKYIRQIEAACQGAQPNAAHQIIARLGETMRVWVLTQNVDGLHAAAGSKNIIAIHGNVHDLVCTQCQWTDTVVDFSELDATLPHCPDCGAVVRPDVVLFGEMLPDAEMARLRCELEGGFDAVVCIGTSAVFPYIREPVVAARAHCKTTVEINPGTSEISELVDFHIRSGAAAAMERLFGLP